MTVTLIITTYKWVSALELVLKSLLKQSRYPDQVIIAEDAQDIETAEVIEKYNKKNTLSLLHINHPDDGFRRSAILNKAIKAATSEYIIQLDGDCIMHKHFVRDHFLHAAENHMLSGYRNHIRENATKKLCKSLNLMGFFESITYSKVNLKYFLSIPWLSKKLNTYEYKSAERVYGCNISYWKKDIVMVNGYDEKFIGWGPEDNEMVQRLINNGIVRKNLRYAAVQFHLYHKIASKNFDGINREYANKTLHENIKVCINGLKDLSEI